MHWLFLHAAIILHWFVAHALDKLLWTALLLGAKKLWEWSSQFLDFLLKALVKPYLLVLEEGLVRLVVTFVTVSFCVAAFVGIAMCLCTCSRRATA